MSHFLRELSDPQWYTARTVPASIVRNIDEKTKKAISESGGTWTPSSPVVIGGAGLELQSGMQLNGNAKLKPAPGQNYVFGDDDYFRFETADRAIVHLAQDFFPTPQTMPLCCRVVGALNGAPAVFSRKLGGRFFIPLRTINGARFVGVDVLFAVPVEPESVPAQLPRARLVRIDAAGEVSRHPAITSELQDEGWGTIVRPASAAAWFNDGDPQTLSLTVDPVTGPTIDRSVYDYAVEWQEKTSPDVASKNENGTFIFSIVASYRSDAHHPY